MFRTVPGPYEPAEMKRFLDTFMYGPEAFLVDEVTLLDEQSRTIEARLETAGRLPMTGYQRASAAHPAHVSGPDLIMITGCLGCMHAWFFHGCRWDEGWIGFGNRIHRADFRTLADIGPPLDLISRETRARAGSRRIVLRYEFVFTQNGREVYRGDQSAMFFRQSSGG